MDYAERLQRERAEKDEYFAEHPRSPIPTGDRDGFDGLDYYDPDPEYRFELELHEFDDHDTIQVDTTQDGEQTYYRWGEFEFELDGDTHTLTAYRRDPGEKQLWVPFTDETNGDTTYPAGRYLDLDEDAERDGVWLLDFNRAYSPFCAYSDAYECPLVPFENHLDTRIEAGERYENTE
ncbi:DUF1684 domain-containing protein [Salarchaeum sp. JOR-1]|uniref:DUF1684 domain-containing protein n=1 Tax=Salarchaeum sp. JOR-1 TaxID=2599399 RepID=UPI0011983782|nr:DUF1684 domain-containing protein [Salarchaeum sp. JOR-1]QDX40594.1 DUF1684 domain-containing protein [Salarchaeum sp. JOR-1]